MVDRLERTFPHQPHLRGVGYVGSNLWALSDKELEGHMWVCWDPPACAPLQATPHPPAFSLAPLSWTGAVGSREAGSLHRLTHSP